VLASAEGLSTELRIAGLALVLTMLHPRVRNGLLWIPLVGGVMATLSIGVAGHAAELPTASGVAAQWLVSIHLLAVAFWLGALWPLHRLTKQKDEARVAAAMLGFGKMAAIVVSVLMAAGGLLLWQLIGKPEELWQSAYGNLILAKLTGVALLLSLAGINKLRLTPMLFRGDTSAIGVLQKTIVAETVVAGLILLFTAAITTLTGPPVLG
jgi:putative copper export protein